MCQQSGSSDPSWMGWHSCCGGQQGVGGGGRSVTMWGWKWITTSGKKKWRRGLCCVTYECLWKALFKEDAGRANDVVQHVAVLHQSSEGIVAWLILLVLILLSLLAHWPPLTILHPLQRQTRLLLDQSVSQVLSTWLLHTWHITSFKEDVTLKRLSSHANIRQNVAVSLHHISCLIFQGDHWRRFLTLLREMSGSQHFLCSMCLFCCRLLWWLC